MSWLPGVRHVLSGSALFALTLAALSPSQAAEPVDVELVLAVDVSLSMSPDELDIQRDGYAAALTHDRVLAGDRRGRATARSPSPISNGPARPSQHVVVPWTIIATREDAERVAAQLSVAAARTARGAPRFPARSNSAAICSPKASIAAQSASSTFPVTGRTTRARR